MSPNKSIVLARQLAALADVDVRTARKALAHGPAVVRGRAGERVAEVLRRIGVTHDEPQLARAS
jgi:hypothetical protein